MEKTFSIREALSFGWEKTKAYSGLLFVSILTLMVINVVADIIKKNMGDTLEGFLIQLLFTFIAFVPSVGLTIMSLKIARGEIPHYGDLLPAFRTLVRCFIQGLLTVLIIVVGLILLIVPGIYAMLYLSMYRFTILNNERGIIDSLKESGRLTEGVRLKILGFFAVIILLNIAGALAFLVGLIITLPVSMLAYAHIYAQLEKRVEKAA